MEDLRPLSGRGPRVERHGRPTSFLQSDVCGMRNMVVSVGAQPQCSDERHPGVASGNPILKR